MPIVVAFWRTAPSVRLIALATLSPTVHEVVELPFRAE
jgi:hypothetical protein